MRQTNSWRVGALLTLAFAAGGVMACNDGNGGVAGVVPVARVELAPATDTIDVGATVQLTARAYDASNRVLAYQITWTGDDYASVSASGLATGIKAGTAHVSAAIGGKTASSTIVVQPVVAALELLPTAAEVSIGRTLALTATPKDAAGVPIDRSVAWTTSDAAVATVSGGVVSGVTLGTATISATSGGLTATAKITVVPPVTGVVLTPKADTLLTSETLQLSATLFDVNGVALDRPVAWSTSAQNVAVVSASGLVVALTPGEATITATSEGLSATAMITVFARAATVVVTPDTADIFVGDTLRLTATARDAETNVLTRTIGWSSTDPARATVDASGLVTALAAGPVGIVASVDDKADTAQVVVAVPVDVVLVTAAQDSIEVAETMQLTGEPRDAAGNALNRPVTWESSDAEVVTVSSTGLVTGVKPGTATIRGRSQGKMGSKDIHVMEPVSSVEIAAPDTLVSEGQTLSLSATARGGNGQMLGRAMNWTSSDASIATVSGEGVVTGVATGRTTISASAGGKRGEVAITVQRRIANILVTATKTMLNPETPLAQLTATPLDASGAPLDRPITTWSTSDAAIMTVVKTGTRTADVMFAARGDATISATAEGVTGTIAMRAMGQIDGTEETNNNLSWPVVFTDGVTLLGDPVGSDAGLRPLNTEPAYASLGALPFWWTGNVRDWLGAYSMQGDSNTWRAQWLDGSGSGMHSANVYFGDNLTHASFNTHMTIHIEVGMVSRDLPPMQGFNMTVLAGSKGDEVLGTDGSIGSFQPMIFSVHPRLVIEKLDAQGGTPLFTLVDQRVVDGFGQDGPGYYRGEINKAGKLVYGFNLKIQDYAVPDGATKWGWYRINFLLEDEVPVNGVITPRHVSLDGFAPSDDAEAPTATPVLEPGGRRAYVDIFISSASGGGGGEH